MTTAYEEWNSLFIESACSIWSKERQELRKTAMLIHILGFELERVKNIADKELKQYQRQFQLIDSIKSNQCLSPNNLKSVKQCTPEEDKLLQNNLTPHLRIRKAETTKNSYISPDVFLYESPDLLNSNVEANYSSEENITIALSESPKINKNKRYMRLNKSKDQSPKKCKKVLSNAKSLCFNQENPPALVTDEIIYPTPEANKRRTLGKKVKNNTLTQMFSKMIENDSEATLCDSDTSKEINLDGKTNIIDSPTKTKGISNFIDNYDKVPKILEESHQSENLHPKCRNCNKYGEPCPKHEKSQLLQSQRTFTGFWDVDFTVKEPPPDDSQNSTIYFGE